MEGKFCALWSVDNWLSHWIFHLLSLWVFFVSCYPDDTQDRACKNILASHLILKHSWQICLYLSFWGHTIPLQTSSISFKQERIHSNGTKLLFFLITYSRNVQILRYYFSLVSHWCWLPYQQSHGGEMQYSQHLPCRPELLVTAAAHTSSRLLSGAYSNFQKSTAGKWREPPPPTKSQN